MEVNAQTLKFNRALYSQESLRRTIKEFRSAYAPEIVFKLKQTGKYFEVAIISKKKLEAGFADEFSNYSLSLNIQ